MKILRSTFILLSYCGLSYAVSATALGQGAAPSTTRTPSETTSGNAEFDTNAVDVDNTKRNKKVTKNAEPTAQDQGNSQADIDLAAKVRRAIVNDESLSVNAHNVKIIAANGQVVLKGPVKSESERTRLMQIANEIVGTNNVKNELEVSH
jgi:hyperosmotically inducible protein